MERLRWATAVVVVNDDDDGDNDNDNDSAVVLVVSGGDLTRGADFGGGAVRRRKFRKRHRVLIRAIMGLGVRVVSSLLKVRWS